MSKNFILHMSLALCVAPLSGCATYSWHHQTKSVPEFDQDRYACIQQSAQSFPMAAQRQFNMGFNVPQTNCGVDDGESYCTTSQVVTPASSYIMDANAKNRSDAYDACLNARGWIRKQDR